MELDKMWKSLDKYIHRKVFYAIKIDYEHEPKNLQSSRILLELCINTEIFKFNLCHLRRIFYNEKRNWFISLKKLIHAYI